MTRPLISIIIPCYNVEQWLPRCLDSLLNQTYDRIEVIAVCDGSPDRTPDILRAYAERDPRVKPIFQTNMGVSMARNNGLAEAVGAYVGFVDSDDYVEPDYVETLYGALVKQRTDIAACNFFLEWESGWRLPYFIHTGKKRLSGTEAIRLSFGLVRLPPLCCNKLYKTDLFRRHDIRFPSHYYEDMATLPRLLMAAGSMAVVDKPLYHYIRHPNSVTRSFGERNVEDYLLTCNAIRHDLSDSGSWDVWAPFFHRLLTQAGRQIWLSLRLQRRLPFRMQNALIVKVRLNLRALRNRPNPDSDPTVLPFPIRATKVVRGTRTASTETL